MAAAFRSTLPELPLLAGCGRAERSDEAAPSQKRGAQPAVQSAYTYSYKLRQASNRLAETQRRHIAMRERLGPCGYGARVSGSTRLEMAGGIAQRFGDALAPPVRAVGGSLVSIDVGTRVRANEVPAAHPTRMIETRTGSTANLVETQKAVAEVREQRDAELTVLAPAQGRIATSPVKIGHHGARTLALMLIALPVPGAAQTAATTFPLRCSFGSKTEGLDVADACAIETANGLILAPAVIARLAFDRGLASIAIHGGSWYYRTRDGRTMRMMTFEMGPDPFAQGLARAMIDGKLAYVDRRLRIRLRTGYDWGEPFAGGRANVCIGCVETRIDRGEHSVTIGGRWGTIDKTGREIVPVRFRQPPSGPAPR